ncbi:hypothetical protein NLI96_g11651 [Meripilus lineatus]|uniref:Uncharacterized protein n=1 Tax=Meripilus lineatus TaxID=2056292 RepID=A0AAD5UST1_9APHY|nr:hypothetical protein NLI96_g11651 [Physisporinus lineatus]
MARPRPRSTSNASLANNTANTRSRPPTTSPQLKRTYVQASDSIYQNNITVLRRREPTILAIFDFFSHVCLYHYTEKGWEKRGFEGTMFLVEHEDFPPYGIYILNRMGTGDFSRRIYPEDDLQETKQFVLYRYYPDYTQKRIEMHLPYPLPPEFRPMFDKEFEIDHSQIQQAAQQNPAKEKKGTSVTLGLWTYPTPTRESLATVMTRLHKFVKAGERYPDEFRYGPGRPPPPPNNRPRSGSQSSVASGAQPGDNQVSSNKPTNPGVSQPENASGVGGGGGAISAPSQPNSAGSEVDKLFAKLQPQLPTDNTPPSSQPPSASSSTSQGWISALNNAAAAQPMSVSAATGSTPSPAPTGLSLLNSIFASVQPSESASSSTGASGLNALSSMPTESSFYPYQPPQPSHAIYPSQMQMIPPQMTTPYLSQTMYPQTYNNQTGFTIPVPLDQAYVPSPGNPHGRYLPPHPEEITIVSPKPTSSALPQILNQEVIAGLLGLSPEASSRASSVAPSVSK